MSETSEFDELIADQNREFMAASALESDLDLAFLLQMEETLAASTSSPTIPSTSAPPPAATTNSDHSSNSDHSYALNLQSLELDNYQIARRDAALCRAETRRGTDALRRRAHDERFAREILSMPEEEWDEYGDDFERPIELAAPREELPFRLYFKGTNRVVVANGEAVHLAGIGAAICDPWGDLLLKIQRPVPAEGTNREVLDAKALIEGLNAVADLGISNVNIYFEFRPLLNHVSLGGCLF